MTSDSLKVLLSIAGVFIGGIATYFEVHRAELMAPGGVGIAFWLGFVMAGLAPVGAYLIGFYQVNQSNQPPRVTSTDGPVPAVTTTTTTVVPTAPPAVPDAPKGKKK